MNTETVNVLLAVAILVAGMLFLYRYAMSAEHRARWNDQLPSGKRYTGR